MALTEQAIKKAKVTNEPRRLTDGDGLYLLINPNGSRWWRMDFQYAGKRKTLSMGTYPNTRLSDARRKRDAARKLLAEGIDPGEFRKATKTSGTQFSESHADVSARERFAKQTSNWARPLEAIGIDDMEERAYRILLAHRMATAEEISRLLAQSTHETQRLLDSIEAKGLASHSPEKPRRYIASSPKLAVEALINQRQAVLERVRSTIPELMEQIAGDVDHDEHEHVVELITSRTALGQILVQMRQTIRNDTIVFQRAPIFYPVLVTGDVQNPGLAKDVRIRSIADASFLALPGAWDRIRQDIEAGEEVRMFPSLPVKMVVADRRIGIVPLNVDDPNGPTLLIRGSSLLNALYALFDFTWERATPIVSTCGGKLEMLRPAARLSEGAEQAVTLLAAGLNDKAIAHEAGISEATLTRRITELMKCFGTRTRFQLGWRAALDAFPEGLHGKPHAGE